MEKYDFHCMKRCLNFCKRNGMNARYHTLLDKQTCENVMKGKEKAEIIRELKSYVEQSINFINNYNEENKRINGKPAICSVDLFNEIISFDKPYVNIWEKEYGISLQDLTDIFQYAKDHKPDEVTYVYNEPFLENEERRNAVIETLKEINRLSPGLIDTLGSQMHIEITQDPEKIRSEFQSFNELQKQGYNIQITEFDMCIPEWVMFDEDGKLQTQYSAETILDAKAKKISVISQIIEDSGVELEGITYWSVSDTLDHNLQRTNQKTWSDGLSRDIASTRYAGLYSFERERTMLFSEQEIGKATMNVPTRAKDTTKSTIQRDEQSIQQSSKKSKTEV